jgi:predicted MPP superfamily phosphohydrolase
MARTFDRQGGRWLMDDECDICHGQIHLTGSTCSKSKRPIPLPGRKNILLIHYPSWIEHVAPARFDLVLAGHSHGGQVRLPGFGPLLVPFGVGGFDMGMYETPAGPLYVNPGLGYFYLNFRFCCRPEITVFEI